MTPELTSQHLDDIDIILVKFRLLEQNNYLQGAFSHTLEAAQNLSSLYEEKRDKDKPVIQKPDQDSVVEFAEGLLKDINSLSANIRKDTESTGAPQISNSIIYLMAWSKLKQAEMFVKAFFEEVSAEKKEFEEYETKLKNSKDIVFIVSEDAKLKSYVEPAIKAVWPTIYEKESVYFHNEIEEYISKFMKAPNVKYDSLHCDECLNKFDLQTTIFFLVGFKQGDKLPVDLPKDAYYVGV